MAPPVTARAGTLDETGLAATRAACCELADATLGVVSGRRPCGDY